MTVPRLAKCSSVASDVEKRLARRSKAISSTITWRQKARIGFVQHEAMTTRTVGIFLSTFCLCLNGLVLLLHFGCTVLWVRRIPSFFFPKFWHPEALLYNMELASFFVSSFFWRIKLFLATLKRAHIQLLHWKNLRCIPYSSAHGININCSKIKVHFNFCFQMHFLFAFFFWFGVWSAFFTAEQSVCRQLCNRTALPWATRHIATWVARSGRWDPWKTSEIHGWRGCICYSPATLTCSPLSGCLGGYFP